jgi:6-pyruvoyltetrahydropterin/6-carboxytetrahydropterin synthase
MSIWTVTKRMEIAGSHCLSLPYESKCNHIHGHNWEIEVDVSCEVLNSSGMVMDFTEIKRVVSRLDHTHLNDTEGLEIPTAELISRWIAKEITYALGRLESPARVTRVMVQESEGNRVCFIP